MKKTDFITKIVIFVLVFLVIFTLAIFLAFLKTGTEPATLVQWVYTVFGLELLVTMFKKYLDKKYGKDDLNEFDTDFDCSADSGSGSDYLLSDSVD